MRWPALVVLLGCGAAAESPGAPGAPSAPVSHHALAPIHCPPPPKPEVATPSNAPPWEHDPLASSPCVETDDGATVTLDKDETDAQGWRERLIVADGSGERWRRDIRAVWGAASAPDGGLALAHVEDAVSRYSATGELMWKTEHPRCGQPAISVGYDGRVVLACGFSLVAYSPDGKYQWQKWPLGNVRLPQVLLLRDGSMIVRGGGLVAGLDADGEVRWRLPTGDNRWVHDFGVLADDNLAFVTSMAAMHTEGEYRFYYETVPDELFVITRDGKLVSRTKIETATPAWPASKPWTGAFRAGRI